MAEKRVSVRLAVVGGREVRAELEGVGAAGNRGFGRLSREMDAANARLAAFSARVKVATAAAIAAAAASGIAMVRSGLATVDAQGKLAQSLGTTVASIQVLERAGELAGVAMSGVEQATKDLTRRLSQAASGAGPAAEALGRLGLSASELLALPLDERVGRINQAIADFVPAAERAAVAGQLFGEEGSIAMLRIDTATLRQATQDVRDFGVVVSEADADRIERANAAISRLGLIWRGLSNQLAAAAAPALEAVANAMAALARTTGPLGSAIRGLFDHLGRLASYAATFAGIMAGRWVAGLIAAAVSVRGLATALVVLRGALIRTGIGALIVAAGEMVYQFGRLVAGAGGFGEALSLLGDVAAEVWERIKLGGRSLALSLQSVWATIEAGWLTALSGIQRSWADFLHAATRAAGSVPGMESTMLALSEAAIRAGSAFHETAAAAGEASARAEELAASATAAGDAATAPLASLQALRDAVAGSGELAGTAAPPGGTGISGAPLRGVDAALDTATKAAAGAAAAIAAVEDRAAELAATLQRDVAQGLGSLFAGLITGATTLKDAVGSVIARLGELALTRGFETLLAGIGFGSGPLGRVASLLLPPTPRAAGGPVMAGLPYLVGERGPELIVPRAPGTVVPNHRLAGGHRGPSAIHVTVTGARGNAEIRQMVEAGVAQGLRAYDARLADRVARIGADPRFRG